MCTALLTLSVLSACSNHTTTTTVVNETKQTTDTASQKDMETQSNADSVTVSHLDLDIKVDMDNKQIAGNARWSIQNKTNSDELRLDTYDLTIDSTLVDGQKVNFKIDSPVKYIGSALHIPITANTQSVVVYYKTGKDAQALQWLTPQQTSDKKYPFLYTQSESIYARSWVPCPDGPGIRYTYSARVTVPKGLMALMSAENPQALSDSGIYHFTMTNPVPAYLMALAVGNIAFRPIDNRTGVYASPDMVDKARWEFQDVGKMVTTAEGLYGPYRWGRYDVLVLPPGFPIGGMENPRLTFCTPTVIAGDRSLVNLIAHELAHSWSGNLVTNATWNDFWMNEGFTEYFERRIMEQMMGTSYSDMLWELGYEDLVDNVNELGATSRDTWLKQNINGRDPDDGFTDIPYEKGSHFLRLIEISAGRTRFDAFLNKYFNEHAFKSITTEQFLAYLNTNLIKGDSALAKKIDINAWVYGPGIPANCPRVNSARFAHVDSEVNKFVAGAQPAQLETKGWTSHEWQHFLRKMPAKLTLQQMKSLDDAFRFTKTGNSEIADLWFVMAINNNYEPAYPATEQFLSKVGREKFIEPLYGAMIKSGKQDMAKRIYEKYKMNYHPLAQAHINKLMNK